jgi:hypothetical protein
LKLLDFRLVTIGQRESEIAVDVYAPFGRGHPTAIVSALG